MNDVTAILDQIPIRYDLASHIMLLGIVQGFFLALVIFLRAKRDSAIIFFGWSLLVQCLVFLDIYLCYTGLMKYTMHLNDSTEFLVLLIAPTLYFFLFALLERKPIGLKQHWPHFILPLLYVISQVNFYTSPIEVKINAYLGAYHNDLGFLEVPGTMDYSYHHIKDQFRWLVLISFAFYLILSLLLVLKSRKKGWTKAKNIKVDKYIFSRNTVIFFLVILLTIFIIYLNFDDDGGDHIIGIIQTATIFITSYFILSESRFFEKSWIADKYETLSGTSVQFRTLEAFIEDSQYYTHQDISLKKISEQLDTNSNTISRLINSETGNNFNDYINQKRIALAQARLFHPEFQQLTVEAIGESVGFRSKSAFYSAFKKHTGQSPSAYMKENRT
ncbi:MAG: helix-turn-helix transcriptional regulator [Muricauda sp.]|jgi:AraC-like DNA-binding protein|nr:helix-turn-helix domain-containing protein [Allomuricauda sp.]MBO6532900.1 helix-turn-helix transcriptional regulator [Allomuricauda sp.]MBO6587675.1 helix-turn-helix transcriptional regulator [Allomuricauda sp.]MBO6617300.1 helix-turn-helix transcriptional regulator [Allomuricauda sp.]MBO6643689.1 helix-turn-helix transcriptional regulator [Allomuricauda sp.]MBO6745635.1 helix-turn-helix transcriptional regulator [Allomuricauda sp.]